MILLLAAFAVSATAAETVSSGVDTDAPPANTASAAPQAAREAAEAAEADKEAWVDTSVDYVADSADRLVQWMDDFYGEPYADFEAAHSSLRLRLGYQYDELEEGDIKVKVRGKVQLPKLSRRLALVLEGDEGEEFEDVGNLNDDEESRLGLQYNVGEKRDVRFDLIGNVNASLDLRAGGRFRYAPTFSENLFGRFTQDLGYETGDTGAFSRSRFDLYRPLDEDNLLAWRSRVDYSDDSRGLEWRSYVQWRRRLEEDTAVTFTLNADGITDPVNLVENYGLRMNYRSSIYRRYLFYEIEPAYMWRKEPDFDNRVGVWSINVRFEIHFENEREKRAAAERDPLKLK
ncbi:hypothetical protein EYC98_17805 [Halieaceae bacterium IMCC14734]|uniref:DUF560 domain-containing protein n=1 Tax=Candidatus Litorirhabdus singularis TaxID=2518993 RepID=A0ABT3TK78_9GAMM|nr:hypothetical protein [Candidatus Litorirhabdus singularis]MCX2982721.1 hypothetical protein [Candidatus Litorirhabdus singularis]